MAVLRKGLRELRTLSGRVDRVALPYRAYLKISCLEMEKLRKTKERESARQNIANIDARLQEIEAEEAALLQALKGEIGSGAPGSGEEAGGPSRPQPAGKFKIRY
jgi:hypothetical protein